MTGVRSSWARSATLSLRRSSSRSRVSARRLRARPTAAVSGSASRSTPGVEVAGFEALGDRPDAGQPSISTVRLLVQDPAFWGPSDYYFRPWRVGLGSGNDRHVSVVTNSPGDTPPVVVKRRLGLRARAYQVLSGVIAAVAGLAPHVLHHVGLLAGTALVAGSGGTVLFGVVGAVAALPLLWRLYRRFRTWRAPLIGGAVFAAMFVLSAFVIGPAISGNSGSATPVTPSGPHQSHH